jgi:Mor family transcriptional regulator
MSYISAEIVLPKELLSLVQEYADGQYLYIPKKVSNHKSWGEGTKAKQITQRRDREIYGKYRNGINAADLASEYYLSIKSIQRIVLKEKRKQEELAS